jgi:hypothetical protein
VISVRHTQKGRSGRRSFSRWSSMLRTDAPRRAHPYIALLVRSQDYPHRFGWIGVGLPTVSYLPHCKRIPIEGA